MPNRKPPTRKPRRSPPSTEQERWNRILEAKGLPERPEDPKAIVSFSMTDEVSNEDAQRYDPAPLTEGSRYARIARDLKIPLRTVRETCREVKRFLRSEAYSQRLEALRSGKSWMRRPEKARAVSYETTGRVGKRHGPFNQLPFIPCSPDAGGAERFRVTLQPGTVEYHVTNERHFHAPEELLFVGLPDPMLAFQERSCIMEDSFVAWLVKLSPSARPRMRSTTRYRAQRIAMRYTYESSGVQRKNPRLPDEN